MKICMICTSYIPLVAGSEVFSYSIAERLVKQGHEVSVVTGRWDPNLKEFEVIHGVKVHRVPVISVKNFQLLSFIPFAVTKAEAIARDSDIIHANLAFSSGFIGAIVKDRTKKPLIVTVQGGDLCDYSENTGKFRTLLKPMVRYALRKADLVHAISGHTKRLAKGLGAKNIHIVPLGIDTKMFHVMAVKKDPNLLISVSRLTPKNGLMFLLKSMTSLTRRYPRLKLLIIGEGEQRQSLENFIKKNQLGKIVMLKGNIRHDQISKYLNRAHIFIRPSIDEGLGIAFLEAMACGVPVVGTHVGGISDVITQGETGLMVASANPTEITTAVSRLLEDKALYRKLVTNGIRNSRKYEWDILTRGVYSLYLKILR